MIKLILYECMNVMHYVMNSCPRVSEAFWLISIVGDCGVSLSKSHHIFYLMHVCFLENLNRDCIGNLLCNMYIFIYYYYGWIR